MNLYFSPAAPAKGVFALSKMMHLIGVNRLSYVGTPGKKDGPVIMWKGDTKLPKPATVPDKAINYGCRDISKAHVSRVFDLVFGYHLSVNPTEYSGKMVEKADENAAHDGKVLNGPIPHLQGDGRVYQILIDNSDDNGFITDIRVPVIGNKLPLVYLKKRPIEERFSNANRSVTVAETADVFAPHEISAIRGFSRAMGMDYGELDVLRDRSSGLIYIVDANKTPLGPPNGLPEQEGYAALRRMGGVFKEQFIDGAYWRP